MLLRVTHVLDNCWDEAQQKIHGGINHEKAHPESQGGAAAVFDEQIADAQAATFFGGGGGEFVQLRATESAEQLVCLRQSAGGLFFQQEFQ